MADWLRLGATIVMTLAVLAAILWRLAVQTAKDRRQQGEQRPRYIATSLQGACIVCLLQLVSVGLRAPGSRGATGLGMRLVLGAIAGAVAGVCVEAMTHWLLRRESSRM